MIITPVEFMLNLNWDKEILEKAKEILVEWDQRPDSFYTSKTSKVFDQSEREHFRNCIDFWERKLNETF